MNSLVITPAVRSLAEKIQVDLLRHFHSTFSWQGDVPGDHERALSDHTERGVQLVANLIAQDKIDAIGRPGTGFDVGDEVEWTSQAGGNTKTKVGVIAQVVPAKGYPDRGRFLSLHKSSGIGMHRDHVSYVVLVGNKPYWPVSKKLSRVTVNV